MPITPDDLLKLLAALLLGGAIGLERELHHKAAGFRTITLICIGATIFTILSIRIPSAGGAAAAVVSGIGFLGAGVIMHEANRVTGLTTAATVWLSAAIGMCIGAGNYWLALATAIAALVVVRAFSLIEHHVDGLWESREYEITIPCDLKKVDHLDERLHHCGLKGRLMLKEKVDGHLVCTLSVAGATHKQNKFVDLMLSDPEVTTLEW